MAGSAKWPRPYGISKRGCRGWRAYAQENVRQVGTVQNVFERRQHFHPNVRTILCWDKAAGTGDVGKNRTNLRRARGQRTARETAEFNDTRQVEKDRVARELTDW